MMILKIIALCGEGKRRFGKNGEREKLSTLEIDSLSSVITMQSIGEDFGAEEALEGSQLFMRTVFP
jgi:hypothetical protein